MRLDRRLLPPVVVAAVIAGGVLLSSAPAGADLAPKTPAQVLVLAEQPRTQSFSGTVAVHLDLGLPDLSGLAAAGGSSRPGGPGSGSGLSGLTELLTGDHQLRVWVDGPQRQRVQVLDQLAETDLVHSGRDAWVYSSTDRSATHWTLPAPATRPSPTDPTSLTPQQLADRFLTTVGPSTQVSAGAPEQVAGRAAYVLRLAPRDSASTIGEVAVAVDADTGLALRVQVFARGQQKPAVDVGFTQFAASAPSASVFAFQPPSGTQVTESALPSAPATRPSPPTGGSPVTTVGSGWTTVLQLPPTGPVALPPELAGLLQPDPAGQLLSTTLVNALRTPDGSWWIGAVTPAALRTAASR